MPSLPRNLNASARPEPPGSRPQSRDPRRPRVGRAPARSPRAEDPACARIFFRIPLPAITHVRFVLEAHEGLAQMTSLPGRGEILWIVPQKQLADALDLAAALAVELPLVRIPPPPDWPETT